MTILQRIEHRVFPSRLCTTYHVIEYSNFFNVLVYGKVRHAYKKHIHLKIRIKKIERTP